MDIHTSQRAAEIVGTAAITVDRLIHWIREHVEMNATVNFSSDLEEIELQIYIYNDWDECNEMYPFYGTSLQECLVQAVVWVHDDT